MPHNFIGLNRKHENFRKGVFIDPFDEPTFLTFALDFKFEDTPSSNPVDEAALSNSPLFSPGKHSARQFLMNRGYDPQANGITMFSAILKYLTFDAPWYFQSIQGLDTLYEKATNQKASLKSEGVELMITTLEAVDLRMNEIAGLYRNAIYDLKFRRERVPDNLRWFSVDIYIAEFRNLRFRLPGVAQGAANALGVNTGAIGNIMGGGNIVSNVMSQFGYMKFSCRQCEFDFAGSVPFKSNINIGGDNRQAESNKFGIKVGWVDEEVKYGDGTKLYDYWKKSEIHDPWGARNIGTKLQNAGTFLSGLPVIGDDIKEAGQKAMTTLSKVGGMINPALGAASNFLEPPVKFIGDAHKIGYASNNDVVPKRGTPPNRNIYD